MSSDAPETGTDEAATNEQPPAETPPETGGPDLAAELEKWKAQARKNEERAKANAAAAKELEEFRKASMSDTEKAIDEAKAAARAEALAEVGSRLVDAEVRVAAAGRAVDVDALLDGLNRSRFLADDGQPDGEAIAEWVDRIAPKGEPGARQPVDMGQGTRPKNTDGQIKDRAALQNMKPEDITKALREGRLDKMLSGS
jgi:hypothetical protein